MILDLDGTLVDTNALHVEAWLAAFASRGYRFGFDRIAAEVGKGGNNLVPALIGTELDGRDGDAIRDDHPKQFKKLAESRGIEVFPGARELIEQLRRRGIRTALATSSGQAHLDVIESAGKL